MDKEQARRIIRNTFESSFDSIKFINFAKELLNLKKEQIEHKHPYSGNFIPDAYKQFISTLERIAKYTDGENEIDLLIVKLKKETSLERARTMQRNFIAWYLKGSRGGELKNGALVAFVSLDGEDWRFSLVKIDYRFNEEGKVDERLSSAKRWSFLVGKNESSHTAQSRLVHILADDQHNPTLTQLEEAFNIEKVTKEFFLKYRNLFLRIKEELDKVVEEDPKVRKDFAEKGVDTVNFAKKFLGQIVFLYFLQKKGWFGVRRDGEWGTGPKDFLRQLFNKKYGNYKNFFNDILEPLFYEALARERDDDFYSRFNCKIPFLNGGLFEPIGSYDWVHTDINLSNELFSNRNDNYEGNGVLDIFDLFNFTVKEDEPLEKEVAIDPELLGKTYEKFNAIRPDNYEEYKKTLKSGSKGEENKFNKKFGIYYTPREIVHYMCQESLINYLHTVVNQELMKQPVRASRQIKLIGPEEPEQLGFHTDKGIVDKKAIEELIKYGEQFTENEQVVEEKKKETKTYKYQLLPGIRKNAKVIDEKLKDIRVCDPAVGSGAFPVGMMAEIVKTRNVLSVYIKEQNRTPYNFKRECIEKSLYGVDIDPGAVEIAKLRLWLSLIVDEEDIKNIKPLPNLDYKIMQGNSLISEFMGIDLDNGKQNNNKNAKLFSIDETKELYEMLKIKKDELLNQTNTNKKKILKNEIENLIIKIFEIKLQEQKSDYFRKIREIEEKYERHPVKEEREKEIKKEKDMLYRKTGFNLEEVEKQLRQYTSNQKVRPFFPWKLYFSEVFQERDGFFVVIANPPYKVVNKKEQCQYKDFLTVTCGDLYAYFFEVSIYKLLKNNGCLSFITASLYIKGLKFEPLRKYFEKNIELFFLEVKGDNVFENVQMPTAVLIGIKSINENKKWSFENFIPNYSIIHKIEQNSRRLQDISIIMRGIEIGRDRVRPSGDIKLITGSDVKKWVISKVSYISNNTAYEFQKDEYYFKGDRVLIRETGSKLTAIFLDSKLLCNRSLYSIKIKACAIKPKYLAAILNSRVMQFYYQSKFKSETELFPKIRIAQVKLLPIKMINEKMQQIYITIVDKILSIIKDEDYLENPAKQANIKEYEHQIDRLVYKLYDLTDEEIKIIEGENK